MERILYFDQTSWLPDNLLERGDRITMAASIEARMPFMDTVLAKLAARLPDKMRINGLTQKFILRRLMKDTLPKPILNRAKVGFRVPVGEWFRGPMRPFLRDCVDSPNSIVQQICKPSEIRTLVSEHESGRQNNERLLWTLMNFELFHRNFNLS
jgi:asparagine synthase (glutamine-hydrolysing)